jgi:hypothetical protein
MAYGGLAYSQSSLNYRLEVDVIGGGDGDGSSANYDLISVIGQPSALESSFSTNYMDYPGFFFTLMGAPEQLGPITLQSPPNGGILNACSLVTTYQPSFQWAATEAFAKYSLFFSITLTDFTAPIKKATVGGTQDYWRPSAGLWKKIMKLSYNNGDIQNIYWKIIGTKADGTTEESEVRSFRIGKAQGVTVNGPDDGVVLPVATPPTFEFNSSCNVKFRLEFSSLQGFEDPSKIKGFNYRTANPNEDTTLRKTLTSGQWTAVKRLIETGTGYFRIKAWDGIKRETISEVRSFAVR